MHVGTLRFVLLKHPVLALAIGLAALLLRIAVPAGFMPTVDQGGLALTSCPGVGPAAASTDTAHGDPSMPGEQYFPPDQPVRKKYCAFRMAVSRNATTDVPLKP
jgi:hypothetical protein